MQLREGTKSTLEMDNKGETDIVALPITGKETPLAFIMTETELLKENYVNIFLSQVIWFVAPVSIIQSLPLVVTEDHKLVEMYQQI